MKSSLLFASTGLLAAAASAAPLAGVGTHSHAVPVDRAHGTTTSMPSAREELSHRHGGRDHSDEESNRGTQVVPNSAGPGESGYGWRYFTDPAAHRAVVISPQGEYYYSRGRGLRLVAVTQPSS